MFCFSEQSEIFKNFKVLARHSVIGNPMVVSKQPRFTPANQQEKLKSNQGRGSKQHPYKHFAIKAKNVAFKAPRTFPDNLVSLVALNKSYSSRS